MLEEFLGVNLSMITSFQYRLRVFHRYLSQGWFAVLGLVVGLSVTHILKLLLGETFQPESWLIYLPAVISGGAIGFWAYVIIKKEYTNPITQLSSCVQKAYDDIDVQFSEDHLLRCWEITDCKQKQCPHFMSESDFRCWEDKGNYCANPNCNECQVFNAALASDVGSLIEVINGYVYRLRHFLNKLPPTIKNLQENNLLISQQTKLFTRSGEVVSSRIDYITDAVQTQASTTQEAVTVILSQSESLKTLVDTANNMSQVITNTATSIDQIIRTIGEVGTRVQEVNELSEQATEEAREGGKAVVDAMCEIGRAHV